MGERYTHLDIRERAVIEMNLALGKCPAQIAVYLNRSRSTIGRLIRLAARLPMCRPSIPDFPLNTLD